MLPALSPGIIMYNSTRFNRLGPSPFTALAIISAGSHPVIRFGERTERGGDTESEQRLASCLVIILTFPRLTSITYGDMTM